MTTKDIEPKPEVVFSIDNGATYYRGILLSQDPKAGSEVRILGSSANPPAFQENQVIRLGGNVKLIDPRGH